MLMLPHQQPKRSVLHARENHYSEEDHRRCAAERRDAESGYPSVRVLGYLSVRVLGYLSARVLGYLSARVLGYLSARVLGYPSHGDDV